jgi:hypothetical protein
MPRTAQSNGIKPYLRALKVIKLGVPVTPQEINDFVGTGDYAAKYISFLRNRNGFEFTIQKDGRKVVSYTMIKEPADAEALRNLQPKATNTKVAKPKVAKSVTAKPAKAATATATAKPSLADIKAKNLETMKKVAAKMKAPKPSKAKKVREFDDVTETFGTSGEVGTSFSVERDWDSVEGLDLKNLL